MRCGSFCKIVETPVQYDRSEDNLTRYVWVECTELFMKCIRPESVHETIDKIASVSSFSLGGGGGVNTAYTIASPDCHAILSWVFFI